MNVRKSNNSLEEFDREKVKNGICKAYEATGEECDELILESIVNSLFLYDNIMKICLRDWIFENYFITLLTVRQQSN